jgi:hypothetical protein
MKFVAKSLVVLATAWLISIPAIAGSINNSGDGAVTWQAGVDGVEIEWGPDGAVNRIYSRYSTPVEFADRRGIKKAQIIAEEKAKAGIIRFFEQAVTSTRIITEIQTDINTAMQTRQTGSAAQISKTDERTLVESLSEITTSFSQGTLSGVVVLETGYDETLEEAWVVVGISRKSTHAARQAQEMVEENVSQTQAEDDSSIVLQESEIRKKNIKDW